MIIFWHFNLPVLVESWFRGKLPYVEESTKFGDTRYPFSTEPRLLERRSPTFPSWWLESNILITEEQRFWCYQQVLTYDISVSVAVAVLHFWGLGWQGEPFSRWHQGLRWECWVSPMLTWDVVGWWFTVLFQESSQSSLLHGLLATRDHQP